MILRAEALRAAGFLHGFTTREGGVSAAPYDSLNLGGAVGDEPAAVAENLRRATAALGLRAPPASARQVHGAVVVEAARAEGVEADALVARAPGEAVAVRVADCVPLLVADRRSGQVAAIHAGWRGTIAGVTEAAVRALLASGSRADELIAAVGPHVGPCCYEVSEELVARFSAAFGAEVVTGRRLDLGRCNELRLRGLGVPAIERVGGCTACDGARFFSHRRDAGRTGRHLAAIASRPVS